MEWPVVIAWTLLGLGLLGGGIIFARSPTFWIDMTTALFWKAWPEISKRMSPEDEAAWRKEQLSGVKPPAPGLGVTTGKTVTQPAKTKRGK
jgi:hypothetical protein